MDTIEIIGGKPLSGSIKISGSKNLALPLIATTVLLRSNVVLYDVPDISDVRVMLDICAHLGAKYHFKDNSLSFTYDSFNPHSLCYDSVKQIRASYYFTPVLARFLDRFSICKPGGCSFQSRPIDLHLKIFKAFGLENDEEEDKINYTKDKLHPTTIDFPYKSVGATINAILMASIIDGVTTLNKISSEVEVHGIIDFLRLHGVDIVELEETLVIKGRSFFNGSHSYTLLKDRIEAGTYLIYGALLGENLEIQNAPIKDLQACLSVFDRLNIPYFIKDNSVIVNKYISDESISLTADVSPDFPSDLLPIMAAYLGYCKGVYVLNDKIYPKRYDYFNELLKLGYVGSLKNDKLIIFPKKMNMKTQGLRIKDLRGGASLILGALCYLGKTQIEGFHHVQRGYSDFLNKLRKVGAEIYEI